MATKISSCCTSSTQNFPPADSPRRSLTSMLLTVSGIVTWWLVPKCPLCLASYVALGSGVSLTLAQSESLRWGMFVLAAGMAGLGIWRMLRGRQLRAAIE